MVKKIVIVGALALLAAGGARPAAADDKFLEPYLELFGARTILASPADGRAKDALQGQASKVEAPKRRFAVSFQANRADNDGFQTLGYGGGLAYADVSNARHPWQVSFAGFGVHTDVGAAESDDSGFDIGIKYVVMTPPDTRLPVLGLVMRYQDEPFFGGQHRFDVLLAADQKLSRDAFLTVNAGWGRVTGGVGADFVAGVGATWRASRQLSVSAEYEIDNDLEFEDEWSIGATWAFDRMSSVRLGTGKHGLVFGNLTMKFDR